MGVTGAEQCIRLCSIDYSSVLLSRSSSGFCTRNVQRKDRNVFPAMWKFQGLIMGSSACTGCNLLWHWIPSSDTKPGLGYSCMFINNLRCPWTIITGSQCTDGSAHQIILGISLSWMNQCLCVVTARLLVALWQSTALHTHPRHSPSPSLSSAWDTTATINTESAIDPARWNLRVLCNGPIRH